MRTEGIGGFLTVGGKRLEYMRTGPPPGAAPALVLLHEGLGCAALWRGFPADLAAATGLSAFAYSRAGYGRSDPADLPRPLDYMTREAVEVLPVVLDSLDLRSCVLVGHSDGATIAAINAGRVRDERLRGIVLMAPHFFTEPMGLAEIAKAKSAFETTDLADRMAKYHDDAEATFRGWNDAWLAPAFRSWNIEDRLTGIDAPVLLVQGDGDDYGTFAQLDAIERGVVGPVTRLQLDGAGHAPHLDAREEVVAAIAAFVGGL